jgi:hypothetical protein
MIMLEALWSIEFVSNRGAYGAGVAVFKSGRVFGGDAQYYYLGTAQVEGNVVNAQVTVTHYAGPMSSIFGPAKQFNLRLTGNLSAPTMEMGGVVAENPSLQIRARLTKRADLP